MQTELDSMVASARAPLGASELVVPNNDGHQVRFELFHAANSICSQKVRVVLAHHGLAYRSNSMDIRAGDTYLPDYVRLRMAACALEGLPLVSDHSGSTSVQATGCDPAVVPLLVDWKARRLVIDSKRICIYLDGVAATGSPLRPEALADAIDDELEAVDGLPNYQMLVGKAPDERGLPASRTSGTGVAFAMSKVERCDHYLKEFAGDDVLERAFRAKRAKERAAAERLFTPQAMKAAYDQAEAACQRLEEKLAGSSTRWLYANVISMADQFWAIELLRMKNLGAQMLWADGARPNVEAFVRQCEAEASIRSAVLDWPGALF